MLLIDRGAVAVGPSIPTCSLWETAELGRTSLHLDHMKLVSPAHSCDFAFSVSRFPRLLLTEAPLTEACPECYENRRVVRRLKSRSMTTVMSCMAIGGDHMHKAAPHRGCGFVRYMQGSSSITVMISHARRQQRNAWHGFITWG